MSGPMYKTKTLRRLFFFLFFLVGLHFIYVSFRYFSNVAQMSYWPVNNEDEMRRPVNIDITLKHWKRKDVQTRTPWKAPIMWEGMFDNQIYDQLHIHLKSSVAVTVFAVGRYLNVYLKKFLTSAEDYFMVALPVKYYIFTDMPEKVPQVLLAPHRSLKVIQVEKHSRWQDISMMRMQAISEIIESEIQHSYRYVFCLDVDQEFRGRFGTEALGDSVALMHALYYKRPKHKYTYDKNTKSRAYMNKGDYYYHAAVFGGTWQNVKNLTDTCFQNILADKVNNVEAVWHDESHLNKYFYLHKPTKVLSPEYCWFEKLSDKNIRIARLVWATKYYSSLRDS